MDMTLLDRLVSWFQTLEQQFLLIGLLIIYYGADHLEAATFDQSFPTLKFRQFFNPSWENVPFDALNKIPRAIFLDQI
jgi:hypothetical protein